MPLSRAFAFAALMSASAAAQGHGHHDHGTAPATRPADHSAHGAHGDHATPPNDHGAHGDHAQPQSPPMDHSAHDMAAPAHEMRGVLGDYAFGRDASGTAWQPDVSAHGGIHLTSGSWMYMVHAQLNAVYDRQDGPRGGEKSFLAGMVMGMARRSFEDGSTLQFRAMLSPDPFMGNTGYPLLLASGETADGVRPLIDRQHPHDLFMELAVSYSHPIGEDASLFLYGGLPGEPAFGPPAFMHRQSILDSPEAPITHHWLDSTHITFGVVTAGIVAGDWKLEASRFHGREPDQHRFDIETGDLDSTAVRLSWNPVPELALQVSWAEQISPEQLHPDQDVEKWSASAMYTRAFENGWWSVTAAWGRRVVEGDSFDAALIEGTVTWDDAWTVFGRAEWTENPELGEHGHHGPAYKVAKASLGLIRDFPIAENTKLGIGGLYSLNFIPEALEHSYGHDPAGAMAFVRLKIG